MNKADHTPLDLTAERARLAWTEAIKRVRAKMMVVCDEIAPLVAAVKTEAEAERIIEGAFVEALDELAAEAAASEEPGNGPGGHSAA